jgi:selenide,water dikinase
MYDPQTSGGLLVAVDQLEADRTVQTLADAGVMAWRIGVVVPRGERAIVIR